MTNDEKVENQTTPIETSRDVDEFDEALDKERGRTIKAKEAAEYNRKKYAHAKEIISEKEDKISDLEDTIERKNAEILKLRKHDRKAREHDVVQTKQDQDMLQWVTDRFRYGDPRKSKEK